MRQTLTIEPYPKRRTKALKRASKAKKPRKTKVSLFREWGVPDGAYRRYTGLKGVYWYWFSKSIRNRDYKEWGGICMTCNEYVEKGQDQCGHVFAAKDCGFELLFHPLNNNLQHASCNNPRFTPSAGLYNGVTVDARYGSGMVASLAAIKKSSTLKEWKKSEYPDKIRQLSAYQEAFLTLQP